MNRWVAIGLLGLFLWPAATGATFLPVMLLAASGLAGPAVRAFPDQPLATALMGGALFLGLAALWWAGWLRLFRRLKAWGWARGAYATTLALAALFVLLVPAAGWVTWLNLTARP